MNTVRKDAEIASSVRKPRLLAWGERSLHAADQIDNLIRRWVVPHDPLGKGRARPSDVQRAVGQGLREEYDLTQPLPARLADLLRQLEQRVV
jgi:hypothetical protein